jgi:hypothetical protein
MAIASPPQTVPTKRMGWQAGGTAKHPKAMRKCSSQGALGTAHAVFPDGIQLLFALEIHFSESISKPFKTQQRMAPRQHFLGNPATPCHLSF